jgi:precorrin-6Y C5,15-methyltransferase (decarboxylating)
MIGNTSKFVLYPLTGTKSPFPPSASVGAPSLLKEKRKIAVLTDKENNPARIADGILRSSAISRQLSGIRMYVCEKLGYPEEKITAGTAEDIAGMEFSEPNVVIIVKRK